MFLWTINLDQVVSPMSRFGTRRETGLIRSRHFVRWPHRRSRLRRRLMHVFSRKPGNLSISAVPGRNLSGQPRRSPGLGSSCRLEVR